MKSTAQKTEGRASIAQEQIGHSVYQNSPNIMLLLTLDAATLRPLVMFFGFIGLINISLYAKGSE